MDLETARTILLQKLSLARQVVEQAFGRLKHRCLLKRCDAGVENAVTIIGVCDTAYCTTCVNVEVTFLWKIS